MGRVKIIKASAGSGKTFTLAYEYILRVILEPNKYRHILAVTFTNKATEEMKRRILSELNSLARGEDCGYMGLLSEETGYTKQEISSRAYAARTRILHDYGRFAVLTIDKFFQRIIRSFIKELGIDLNFNLELQTDSLVSKTADALIERLGEEEELRRWISEYVEERIDGNMRWDIKSGLVAIARELFRENFKRIASESPSMDVIREILKVAAAKYNKAVKAMQSEARDAMDIMSGAGLSPEDFVYGRGGVGGYIRKISEGRIEEFGTRVAKAMESEEAWCSKSSQMRESILHVAPHLRERLCAICGIYTDNARFIATYELLKDNYRRFALLGDLARIMEEICAEESIMPISETNNILGKLISGNDSPFIFEKAGNYFDTFMIDEFQDTSTMQWENFLPLLHNAVSQSEDSPVLLVGDVKQSIYRWRGGDWRILSQGVDTAFDDAENKTLSTNWRSRPVVVDFNNRILANLVAVADDSVKTILKEAEDTGAINPAKYASLEGVIRNAYEGHEQEVSGSREGGYVTVTYYGIEQEEAVPPVIRRIEELQDRGFTAGQIAVLVRRNAEGVEIADMLLEHKGRNPGSKYCYDVVTQEALTIGNSPVVNFVMACFRLSEGDFNIPEKVFYNRFLSRAFGSEPDGEERDFITSVRSKPVPEAFDEIVRHYDLGSQNNTPYLQALHDQVLSWTASRVGDMPLFIKWWDENGARQSVNAPVGGNAITIVSIHKSKGLEYPAVIIPYCDWSMVPNARSLVWTKGAGSEFEALGNVPVTYSDKMGKSHFSEGYYDEMVMSYVDNINLFYVAATRARDELHIMIPRIPKPSPKISALVHAALSPGELPSAWESETVYLPDQIVLTFGKPVNPSHGQTEDRMVKNLHFRSYGNEGRIKQKRSYLRFEEDGADTAISPRDHGILMHKVFETSQTREDIFDSISALEQNGDITACEKAKLEQSVRIALSNPFVSRWFEESWERVYNECDIIIPGSPYQRRPDRVMESCGEVIVVDYKFGAIRDNKHHKQVSYYMNILGQMTGKPVKGYIWYVTINEVAEI